MHRLDLLRTETLLTLALAVLCLLLFRNIAFLKRFALRFDAVARRRRLSVFLVFFLAILLRVALLPVEHIRPPGEHDEFSYLLMGDTFAHGRISNPTHPMWEHFESFHIIEHPVYASVYPVAQGLFLALGEAVFHAPWFGVWISVALMCAAFCWMLQAWLPPSWALAGGVLAAIRLGTFSYWMNSYYGGATSALGGALVLGALPRLMRGARPLHAIVLAIGIALLANSRPYEGMMLCIPVVVVFVAWLVGSNRLLPWLGLPARRVSLAAVFRNVIPLLVIVLGLTGAMMACYFHRISGSAWKMPAMVEREQYGTAPIFVWQKIRSHAPHYNHEIMQSFYRQWETISQPASFRLRLYWRFFLGPVLTVPLLMGYRVVGDRRTRFLFLTLLWSIPTLLAERWANAHYFGPFVPALYAIVLQAARHFCVWIKRRDGVSGRWAALRWAVPAVVVTMLVVRASAGPLKMTVPAWPLTWATSTPSLDARADVIRQLRRIGGRHLVIVRYDVDHSIHDEWVYNGADIDGSPIVWARDMGDEQNGDLIRYFAGRDIWLLQVGSRAKLTPLSQGAATGAR